MALSSKIRLLHQALSIEAKNGFVDLVGHHSRFSEFVAEQLSSLSSLPSWQALDALREDFEEYPKLDRLAREGAIHRLLVALPRLYLPAEAPKKAKPRKSEGNKGNKISGKIDQGVQVVKGVGASLAESLAKMGILTVEDLLHNYPRKHLDFAQRTEISKIPFGEPVTVWGTIQKVEAFSPPSKPHMSIVSVTLSDDSGKITARWFYGKSNRYQLERYKARFPVGEAALLSGIARFDDFLKKPVMERPDFEFLGKAEDSLHVGRIVPIYFLTEGLSLKLLRRAIHNALETYSDRLPDLLPESWREEMNLGTRAGAIREIHFPSSQEELKKAKKHLVFLEFFWFQLGLAFRRSQRERESLAPRIASSGKLTNQFLQNLPFSLTGAQSRVFEEVLRDLRGIPPMNRLVQGDVGSGKTVVALLALLAAVEAGFQGAIMAPTEILAEQHYRKFQEWLVPLGVHPALLLGKQTAKEREAHLRAIIAGDCPITVGTHALIQESVAFKNLGLVVIDEQHRFGVRQRAKLRSKGLSPQLLAMTATPIPRTLSLVTHGDLDVSIIDELPPGRKNILTRWVKGKKEREDVWKMIEDEVARGFQAYVVFPLVEESEKLDVKAATQEKARLEEEVFPDRRVALLHGQMHPLEKEEVIEAFRRHETDILVSTTVIEVGVDVPNATVMVIENAERFGLSQLHQLRGRVGRGGDQAYCFLATGKTSDEVKRRMEVMVSTNDGFLIAEEDLRLRGPGEFLGTRQSGLPEFRLADIVEDAPILEEARRRAQELLIEDPLLEKHPSLKEELFLRQKAEFFENLEAG